MAKTEVDTSKYYWVTSPWKAMMARIRKIQAANAAKEKAREAAEKAAAAQAAEEAAKAENVAKIHAPTTRIR